MYNEGALIIGQENDNIYGGFFDITQAFSGKLTQTEIWNTILPPKEIEKIASCKQESTMPSNR